VTFHPALIHPAARILFLVFLFGRAAAAAGVGDTLFALPESGELSLAGVVEATYRRNPTLQLLRARMDEAAAIRRQADSLVAGDAALQVRHNTGQVGNVEGLREWEWGVELPIWLPGQRAARRNVAKQRRLAVAASGSALRLAVAGQVRNLLWTLRINRNQAHYTHRAWLTARDLQQDVARRAKAGELAHLDLVLARQEALDRKDAFQQAEAMLRRNYHRYRILTGLDRIPAEFREAQAAARQVDGRHPALADAMAAVAADEAVYRRVRSDRRENPTLTLGTRHERPDAAAGFENTLGITLRIPLGLPSQSAPGIAASATALAESRTAMDLLKRQLDTELQAARDELAATRTALETARNRADLARENLALIRRSFDLGESNLFHLLQVQARAFEAELKLHRKTIELRADIARYNQAIGIIP
jgi:cobalt-zinc-cadmium efflux system outer membrane protein